MLNFIKHRFQLLNHFMKLSNNWLTVLLSVYHIKNNENTICKLKNGVNFFVKNPSDVEAIIENWVPEWGHGYFSKFKEIAPKNSMIDIGAHIGTFTVYMAYRSSNLKIFSYEPDKDNFKLLEKNIVLNNLMNVKIHNLAVAEKSKTVKLFSKNNKEFGTMGTNIINENTNFYEIRAISLLDILKDNKIENCDLLKMDCEGAEYDILLNQGKECFERIQNIVMEYHILQNTNLSQNDLKSHLQKFNFFVKLYPRDAKYGFLLAQKLNKKK